MKTDIAGLLREDVYAALRARSQRNRPRFALEFDADKAAMERCKCAAQPSDYHKALLAALDSIPNLKRTTPDTNNAPQEPIPTMQPHPTAENQRPATTTEPTDVELVAKAKAGDLSAFDALVTRHERRIYSLAFRILQHQQDAEDVTQQTFLSALEHLSGFREEASFATWLSRIATHAALKVIRKRRATEYHADEEPHTENEEHEPLPHPEFIADWSQSPEHLAQQNETRRLIEQALQELDDKHRLVFILRDVEGLSVKDTAATLGISEVNVKVRL
ncbi:MAG: sigma-70 family RNA polymerase sigma factor, partial [Verrucomicrobiia bacterium]